jgi:hypothetical protein
MSMKPTADQCAAAFRNVRYEGRKQTLQTAIVHPCGRSFGLLSALKSANGPKHRKWHAAWSSTRPLCVQYICELALFKRLAAVHAL